MWSRKIFTIRLTPLLWKPNIPTFGKLAGGSRCPVFPRPLENRTGMFMATSPNTDALQITCALKNGGSCPSQPTSIQATVPITFCWDVSDQSRSSAPGSPTSRGPGKLNTPWEAYHMDRRRWFCSLKSPRALTRLITAGRQWPAPVSTRQCSLSKYRHNHSIAACNVGLHSPAMR